MTCADLQGKMGRDSLEKKKIKNEINFVKFPKIGHRPPSNKIIPQNLPPPPTKQNFVSGSMPEMCHHGCTDLTCWLH